MSTPVRWLASLEDFYSWGSQTNSFAPKFINLAQSAKDSWRDQYEQELRRYLPEVKAVSEDKREAVTITSVKMVGGVAPEAELMRQAVAQLEGMGFRVEHPKATSDMGNPISQAHGELPPLSPHDHPEPRSYMWSSSEIRAIQDYARKAVALAAPKIVQPLIWDERKAAEHEYTVTAFNYPDAPIGSRDWTLYWAGWLARSTAHGIKA